MSRTVEGRRCNMPKEIIRNSRILIIDDQPEIILLLDNILRQDGYVHLRDITDSRKALQRHAPVVD
jgi:CheY-like chemotaxis protein